MSQPWIHILLTSVTFHFSPHQFSSFSSSLCFLSSACSSFSLLIFRFFLLWLGFTVVWSSTISNRSSRSRKPLYTSSHTNSSVYVVFFWLTPLRQTNSLPKSCESRGIMPSGYFWRKVWGETMVARPLIQVKGLKSPKGVMYSSF